MDKIAAGPASDRRDLFRESASRLGMNPAIVEKDFWVCWILKLLFAEPALKNQTVFKGGTNRVLTVFISEVFRFEILGFEQDGEDACNVYFRDVEIGEFDAEALRLPPVHVMR